MRGFLNGLRDYVRPITVAALIFVLLFGATLSGALEAVWPGLGERFTIGVAGWFRAVPDAYYQLVAAGFLGYTAGRTLEKVNKPADAPEPDGEMV